MKSQILFLLIGCLGISGLSAQEAAHFASSISIDSILLGNSVEVKFTLQNAESEKFYAPKFEDFEIVSGPNTAISMSILNGAISRSTTYSYYIKPIEVGDYFIPPASVETEDGFLETEPIAVQVVPNPDGIIQQPKNMGQEPFFGDSFFGRKPFDNPFFKRNPSDSLPPPQQQKKPKKKRKITKI